MYICMLKDIDRGSQRDSERERDIHIYIYTYIRIHIYMLVNICVYVGRRYTREHGQN